MKQLFKILPFIIIPLLAIGQKTKEKHHTDTLRLSFSKTVYLVFDTPVKFEDHGSDNVIVKTSGNKVFLGAKIKKFSETNLLVETESGFYSFILVYNENPKKLLYKYDSEALVLKAQDETQFSEKEKNNKVGKNSSPEQSKVSSKTAVSTEDFPNDCQKIVSMSNSITTIGVFGGKMLWSLGDIYVKDDYLYFKVCATNKSNIKYDVDLIKFVIRNSKGNVKQKAVQEDIVTPLYVFNGPKMQIEGKSALTKVFVFQKFTIDDEKKLFIELWEVGGDRKLEFGVTDKDILKVKKL